MFIEMIRLFIASAILVIIFFAYVKKETLPKLVTLIILASIAVSMALNAFAGIISGIDFLNFLENALKTLASLVVYLEIGLIIFVMFFSQHKTKITLLKVAIIGYMVLVLLLALGVFK